MMKHIFHRINGNFAARVEFGSSGTLGDKIHEQYGTVSPNSLARASSTFLHPPRYPDAHPNFTLDALIIEGEVLSDV